MNKKCNTVVVFEVAFDVQSIKLKEKPEVHSLDARHLNELYSRWGTGGAKIPPPPFTSFSPVTSTKVGISPQNFLTFRF